MRHTSNPIITAVAVLVWQVSSVGCGDDANDEDTGSSSQGRGSVACQAWQDAICDFIAGDCGLLERATCDAQYQGTECRDDALATQCENAFNDASCSAPPASCDVLDVADPTAAVAACDALLDAICARNERCTGSTADRAECTAAQGIVLGFDCTQAIAVDLRYENCLSILQSDDCSSDPQAACRNVLRVTGG